MVLFLEWSCLIPLHFCRLSLLVIGLCSPCLDACGVEVKDRNKVERVFHSTTLSSHRDQVAASPAFCSSNDKSLCKMDRLFRPKFIQPLKLFNADSVPPADAV
jgi:hypothetical protein